MTSVSKVMNFSGVLWSNGEGYPGDKDADVTGHWCHVVTIAW